MDSFDFKEELEARFKGTITRKTATQEEIISALVSDVWATLYDYNEFLCDLQVQVKSHGFAVQTLLDSLKVT